jgi:hypothetical protein
MLGGLAGGVVLTIVPTPITARLFRCPHCGTNFGKYR